MTFGLHHDGAARSRTAAIAETLDSIGLLDRLLWLRQRMGIRALTVFTYHRIGAPGAVTELDPALFEVEPTEFEAQLAVLRGHCTVVSTSDLRLFRRGRPLPPNPVLVTFDDGYLDNYEVALPILRRMGVPATFFIPTAFPDTGKLFWWDRVWLILRRCPLDEVSIEYPYPLIVFPRTAPETSARLVVRAIKHTPGLDWSRFWETFERATQTPFDPAEERTIAERTIMSWSHVRALEAAGMDVQSHTHDHRVLNTLTPEETHRDLVRSAGTLRDTLGRDTFSVAYPVGYELHGDLRRAIGDARFELGFTNNTGLCRLGALDPLNVPRISMGPARAGALYKALVLVGARNVRGKPPLHPVLAAKAA